MEQPKVFRLGTLLLAPARRQLSFGDVDIALGARAFDLLLALVRRQGELASKDELMAEVWSGSIVEENNLAAQVSALRKALSVDPQLLRDLQTVPGRGYRLVAKAEPIDDRYRPDDRAPPSRDGLFELPSLVVLPFVFLGSDPEQSDFAEGLSQIISTDLSRISGLIVIATASAATFERPPHDIRYVCHILGVQYALLGGVQRMGRTVRVNARLIDGQTGVQIWTERFDGDTTDLFSLQDQITGRIANSIGREIFVAAVKAAPTGDANLKAIDFVMRGIAADNRPQSLEGLRQQESLFARAVALDPTNSEALARLARAIVIQLTQAHTANLDKAATLARGAEAAETAIALDPGNPRGHYAMGLVHVLGGDFERAALANEAAIELDRNFALAHNNLGNCLVHLARAEEALSAVGTALRLDPRGPQVGASWTVTGLAHLLLGDTEQAVTAFQRARSANHRLPRAHAGAAIALAKSGDVHGARRAAADLLVAAPGFRLSHTIDACLPTSPPAYRQFYERVLRPAAAEAGIPI